MLVLKAVVAGIVILGALGAMVYRWIMRSPVCQCDQPDCGGGCWGGDLG